MNGYSLWGFIFLDPLTKLRKGRHWRSVVASPAMPVAGDLEVTVKVLYVGHLIRDGVVIVIRAFIWNQLVILLQVSPNLHAVLNTVTY